MKLHPMLPLLVLAVSFGVSSPVLRVLSVMIHSAVALTCDSCPKDLAGCRLIYRGDPYKSTYRTVMENGAVTQHYKERVRLGEDGGSVIITHAEYNDGGVYDWVCGEEVESDITLKIQTPDTISADVGGIAELPCFIDTNVHHVNRTVRWERLDGELVLQTGPGRDPVCGIGFEKRASVPEGGDTRGDFTLTLADVGHSDQGTFRCIGYGEDKSNPGAVKLQIKAKGGFQGKDIAIVVLVLICVGLVVGMSWYCCNQRRGSA